MKYEYIMVRFGELSTKGKNKADFIKLLAKNIKSALSEFKELTYETRYDHIYVKLNGLDYEPVIEVLKELAF